MREFQNILVTGGCGFIGSAFVRWAHDEHPEWRIRVLDKLTYAGNRANLANCIEDIDLMIGDICDPSTVMRAMMDGIDAVIHFAAESHVDRSLIDDRTFLETNVMGTHTLLQMAKRAGVKRFLQVSTDEVYGDIPTLMPSGEEDTFNPSSPYAASKAAAEHLALAYHRTYGLDVVVTRGANTYGSHQYPEKIVPLFITNALQDKPLPIYGNGSAVRDYLHVHDHVRGIDVVLHEGKPGWAYNLGTGDLFSATEVATRIGKAVGKPVSLKFVEDRPGHDYRYHMNSKRAGTLGWYPAWTFADGLQQTADWYAANRHWWQPAVDLQTAAE
jgi:dTDP-glucose 4,6-dehydratase